MNYPRIYINLKKLYENTKYLLDFCSKKGITFFPVVKVLGGDKKVIDTIIKAGATAIGDSRIMNLKKFDNSPIQKLLVRLPMLSAVQDVVRYSDMSLNSEIVVIKALNQEAQKQSKIHGVILMVELGDLREGVLPKDLDALVQEVLPLDNIAFKGIGVNMTCYGAILPDEDNIGVLSRLAEDIEKKYNITLPIISGGNSSSVALLLSEKMPKNINNLRIGDCLFFGKEASYFKRVGTLHTDIFRIEAELIELKDKATLPTGTVGLDAFGEVPTPKIDRGIRRRGIVALGRQEININAIYPIDPKITIIGGSGDHTILDMEEVKNEYQIGDIVSFTMDYSTLLGIMTSPYITRVYEE